MLTSRCRGRRAHTVAVRHTRPRPNTPRTYDASNGLCMCTCARRVVVSICFAVCCGTCGLRSCQLSGRRAISLEQKMRQKTPSLRVTNLRSLPEWRLVEVLRLRHKQTRYNSFQSNVTLCCESAVGLLALLLLLHQTFNLETRFQFSVHNSIPVFPSCSLR